MSIEKKQISSEKEDGKKHFSLKFKLIWGVAGFGTSLISGVYGALLTIFYQDYLGLESRWISITALIYAIWNAVNDPLFGFMSDSSQSEKGRRVPFMKYTAPFLLLTFIAVWMVPPGLNNFQIFWWMLITMLLYDTAYTIIGLVYSALLPEITESDKERGELQTFASVFQLVGMILGFLLPDLFREEATSTNLFPLQMGMVVVGIVGASCILVTAFNVKERREFSQVDQPLGFIDSIKYTFKSKSFMILSAANFMSIFMQSIIIGSMYYLADYVLDVPTIYPLIAIFLGLLIGVFLANLLAEKLGVVKAQQTLMSIAGIFLALIIVVPKSIIYVCLFIAGFGLSGPQVLTNVLFAEVADEDELESGVRREASFFGVNALLTKPAQSISLALVPWILEITDFVTRKENNGVAFKPQPDSAVMGIKLFIGLIPGIALLIGALILVWFPLKGAYLKEVQTKVLALHKDKKYRLDEMEREAKT